MLKTLTAAGLAVAALAVPASAAVLSTISLTFDVELIDNDSSGSFTAGDDYEVVGTFDGFFPATVNSVVDAGDPYFDPTIDTFSPPPNSANSSTDLVGDVFGFDSTDNVGGTFTLGGFTFTFAGVQGSVLDVDGDARGATAEGFISISGNGFGTVTDASYRFSAESSLGVGQGGTLQINVPADFELPPTGVIPVPASLPLLVGGLLGLGMVARRRRKA